jgi:hypothetical protein
VKALRTIRCDIIKQHIERASRHVQIRPLEAVRRTPSLIWNTVRRRGVKGPERKMTANSSDEIKGLKSRQEALRKGMDDMNAQATAIKKDLGDVRHRMSDSQRQLNLIGDRKALLQGKPVFSRYEDCEWGDLETARIGAVSAEIIVVVELSSDTRSKYKCDVLEAAQDPQYNLDKCYHSDKKEFVDEACPLRAYHEKLPDIDGGCLDFGCVELHYGDYDSVVGVWTVIPVWLTYIPGKLREEHAAKLKTYLVGETSSKRRKLC